MDAELRQGGKLLSARPLIIGVGNEMRGDDAAGLLVIRRLREIGVDADLVESDGDGAELIEAWRDAEEVILVDAVLSGAPAGTIHCFDACAEPVPATFRHGRSTHLFSVAEAIELARSLLRLPPHLTVYGIEGAGFEPGDTLTAPVRTSVAAVASRIVATLSSHNTSRR